MKKRLYDEYLRRLLEVNDESKTDDAHRLIEARFRGWLEGVEDAAGHRLLWQEVEVLGWGKELYECFLGGLKPLLLML